MWTYPVCLIFYWGEMEMERKDPKYVAKDIRKILKREFPDTKFSVKTERYAGGSSIHVRWVDGVSRYEVDKFIGHMHGSDFDGMEDLMYSNDRPYGNDFLFLMRDVSDENYLWCINCVLDDFGEPIINSLNEMVTIDFQRREFINRCVAMTNF